MSEPSRIPPQPLSPSETRTWSIVAHAGTFVAAWIAMGVLCPLIVWLLFRDRSEFVRRHAVESLNFQISLLIYAAVGVVVSIATLGIGLFVVVPLAVIFGVFAIVVIVMAALAAADGRDYRYPLTIRLVR